MRVLYGVQATGNGHITRARVMAPALVKAGVEVDYLFSGRLTDDFFDMDCFGNYKIRRGMTFHTAEGGRVCWTKTLLKNSLLQLYRDIKALDLSKYDLIISDFEPITAWAARLNKKTSLGIAHQYAFLHDLPDAYYSLVLNPAIRLFAPVEQAVGIHWNHFNCPIVPPLIRPARFSPDYIKKMILVYMPYELNDSLYAWFSAFPDFEFRVYSGTNEITVRDNVIFYPLSRENFEKDLSVCDGVISNCGFGLASETMQYGKKFLSKPMKGQMEQQSNAYIIKALGLATVVQELNFEVLEAWLQLDNPFPKQYPDVAMMLSEWIGQGCLCPVEELVKQVWADTH